MLPTLPAQSKAIITPLEPKKIMSKVKGLFDDSSEDEGIFPIFPGRGN
jgi:hypothetical protein